MSFMKFHIWQAEKQIRESVNITPFSYGQWKHFLEKTSRVVFAKNLKKLKYHVLFIQIIIPGIGNKSISINK